MIKTLSLRKDTNQWNKKPWINMLYKLSNINIFTFIKFITTQVLVQSYRLNLRSEKKKQYQINIKSERFGYSFQPKKNGDASELLQLLLNEFIGDIKQNQNKDKEIQDDQAEQFIQEAEEEFNKNNYLNETAKSVLIGQINTLMCGNQECMKCKYNYQCDNMLLLDIQQPESIDDKVLKMFIFENNNIKQVTFSQNDMENKELQKYITQYEQDNNCKLAFYEIASNLSNSQYIEEMIIDYINNYSDQDVQDNENMKIFNMILQHNEKCFDTQFVIYAFQYQEQQQQEIYKIQYCSADFNALLPINQEILNNNQQLEKYLQEKLSNIYNILVKDKDDFNSMNIQIIQNQKLIIVTTDKYQQNDCFFSQQLQNIENVNRNYTISIQDLLDGYQQSQIIEDVTCPFCKQKSNQQLAHLIIKVNQYVFMQINRFQFTGQNYVKNETSILIQPTIDICGQEFHIKYMIVHIGQKITNGHYIGVLYEDKQYWVLDDAKPHKIQEQDLQQYQKQVYVVVYERI